MQTENGLSGQDLLAALRRLRPLIEQFAQEHYGPLIKEAAWGDFSRWGKAAIVRDQAADNAAFSAWSLFTWLPDDSSLVEAKFKVKVSDHALAHDFLAAHRETLSALEQGIAEVASTSPFGFYVVQSIESVGRMQLREVYTGHRVVVEGVAVNAYAEGDVLYTAVLCLNGVAVLLGCMPQALGADQLTKLEGHRLKWTREEGREIDRRLLYLHDSELRRLYFVLLGQSRRARLH